jgi:hypothetical protein
MIGRRLTVATLALAIGAGGAATLAQAGARATPPSEPGVHLRINPGFTLTASRVGDLVRISGRVRATTRSTAAIEGKTIGRWVILAQQALGRGGGRFMLHWSVPKTDAFRPLSLRLVVLVRGRVAAATIPVQTLVGPAVITCATPVPPAVNIAVGDGWITGGAYIIGGPAPGLDECVGQRYTVTATNATTGAIAATQTVAGGHSYTLVVPAGSYVLKANGCSTFAPVKVTAGAQTPADVDCDVP